MCVRNIKNIIVRTSAELSLNEELRVKDSRSRVERSTRDGRVDVVGSSDSVRSKECNNLISAEASIAESGKNAINSVCEV